MVSQAVAERLGGNPLGEILSYGQVAGPDASLLTQPSRAILQALERAGKSVSDVDLFELNEAFAAQAIAVINALHLDVAKVNINGGAIALGHPLGCTGAKLSVQMLGDLKRLNKKYGMVSACVGGGQGIAGLIERF